MTQSASERNYASLLEAAKAGKSLPPDALLDVKSQLRSKRFKTDPYTLLHILSVCRDSEAIAISTAYTDYGIEDSNDDGMIRRLALQILGRTWEVPDSFEGIAKKAFEDPSPYVRCAAATMIGHLGARYPKLSKKAARWLLKGLGNRAPEYQEEWEAFHQGLLELFSVPTSEWPNAARQLNQEDTRWDLIARANEVAGSEDSEGEEKGDAPT